MNNSLVVMTNDMTLDSTQMKSFNFIALFAVCPSVTGFQWGLIFAVPCYETWQKNLKHLENK